MHLFLLPDKKLPEGKITQYTTNSWYKVPGK